MLLLPKANGSLKQDVTTSPEGSVEERPRNDVEDCEACYLYHVEGGIYT